MFFVILLLSHLVVAYFVFSNHCYYCCCCYLRCLFAATTVVGVIVVMVVMYAYFVLTHCWRLLTHKFWWAGVYDAQRYTRSYIYRQTNICFSYISLFVFYSNWIARLFEFIVLCWPLLTAAFPYGIQPTQLHFDFDWMYLCHEFEFKIGVFILF